MNKTLFAILALSTASAFAQGSPAEVKAQGKVDQETIKAHERVNKAVTKEAQANIDADAKADKEKLKAHQRTQKEVHKAAADVAKAQNKAEIKAAKEAR